MSISREQVANVAQLARLTLSEEELERYSQELISILDYIDELSTVDTTGVEPLASSLSALGTSLRADREGDSPELKTFRQEFPGQFPDSEGTFLKVPKMTK